MTGDKGSWHIMLANVVSVIPPGVSHTSFAAGGSIPYDRKVADKQSYLTGYLWWVACCKAILITIVCVCVCVCVLQSVESGALWAEPGCTPHQNIWQSLP